MQLEQVNSGKLPQINFGELSINVEEKWSLIFSVSV